MKEKGNKNNLKQELIKLLEHRIRLIEIEKQNYDYNPTLMKNVKMANIVLVQNDIEDLEKILNQIIQDSS
jgi:hypothetical protein